MRVVQPKGMRGSLKWIQRAINERREIFDASILPLISSANCIQWLSPLANDEYAEYRDAGFLEKIGQTQLCPALSNYWPSRGPQWDALGRADSGDVLLVEAKAHIDEIFSAGTQAKGAARLLIESSLLATTEALKAKPLIPWSGPLYQSANRIAHLRFLNNHGVPARLLFVCFVGDEEMTGPATAEEWTGALRVINLVLGLPKQHPLAERINYVFVPVFQLK